MMSTNLRLHLAVVASTATPETFNLLYFEGMGSVCHAVQLFIRDDSWTKWRIQPQPGCAVYSVEDHPD